MNFALLYPQSSLSLLSRWRGAVVDIESTEYNCRNCVVLSRLRPRRALVAVPQAGVESIFYRGL